MSDFRARTTEVFHIFARNILHQGINSTSRHKILASLGAKSGQKERGASEQDKMSDLQEISFDSIGTMNEENLVDLFEKFVWSKSYKKMGRPV